MEYLYGFINDEEKILSIERKIKCESFFEEETRLNYEEYNWRLVIIFHQLTNIGSPLHLTEEVAYLISGIKESNNEMKMVNITVKTDITGMAIDIEIAIIHLSNCLLEAQPTHRILSVE